MSKLPKYHQPIFQPQNPRTPGEAVKAIEGASAPDLSGEVFIRGKRLPTTSGSGDVVGPASAVSSNVAAFDGATGKLLKDSGKALSDIHSRQHAIDSASDHSASSEANRGKFIASNPSTGALEYVANPALAAIALAPGSDTRNVITPSGDYKNLVLKMIAGQTKNPFSVTDELDALKAYITTAGEGYFAGNVGIGTNSPASIFHIATTPSNGAPAETLHLSNPGSGAGTGASIGFYHASLVGTKNARIRAGGVGTNAGHLYLEPANGSDFTTAMVLLSAGNVGIGTSSPTAQVHIANRATDRVGLKVQGIASQAEPLLQLLNSIGGVLLFADKDGILQAAGYKSSDGSAGATATTGGLVHKNGLYISGDINPGLIGTKEADESAIGNNKILVYKTASGKFEYETKPTGGTTGGVEYSSGSIAEYTDGTAKSTTNTAYTKVKSVMIPRSGTLTVVFGLERLSGGPGAVYGQIYVNGSAVGMERSTTSFGIYSEDIAGLVAGDTVELWLKAAAGETAYNLLFRLDCAVPTVCAKIL